MRSSHQGRESSSSTMADFFFHPKADFFFPLLSPKADVAEYIYIQGGISPYQGGVLLNPKIEQVVFFRETTRQASERFLAWEIHRERQREAKRSNNEEKGVRKKRKEIRSD